MAAWDGESIVLREQRFRGEAIRVVPHDRQGHIDLSAREALQQLALVARDDLQAFRFRRPPGRLDGIGNLRHRVGRDHTEAQGSGGPHVHHRGLGQIELVLDAPGVGREARSGVRYVHPLAGSLKQRGTQQPLELADADREGRLGHIELFGRLREAAAVDDGQKIAQKVSVNHRHRL